MLNKEELDLKSGFHNTWQLSWTAMDVGQKLRQERSYGHQAGAETVHVIAEEASALGHQISDFIYVLHRKLESPL